MGLSEKRSLRCVVGPRGIQTNTCGGFLCHAEALRKHKPKKKKKKKRNADKGAHGLQY